MEKQIKQKSRTSAMLRSLAEMKISIKVPSNRSNSVSLRPKCNNLMLEYWFEVFWAIEFIDILGSGSASEEPIFSSNELYGRVFSPSDSCNLCIDVLHSENNAS